jgi:UDP-N-acetylmuramoylalanine--D-glutamate ligase
MINEFKRGGIESAKKSIGIGYGNKMETKSWKILDFIKSFGEEGVRMTEIQKYIFVELNDNSEEQFNRKDGLDRYDYKFENYVASKFRVAMNQTESDFLIYDADDEVIVDWLKNHPVKSQLLPFSIQRELDKGACRKNENIRITTDINTIEMTTDALLLEGKHNLKNTMAASTVANLVRIRKETIRQSIANFQGAPHRLEKVLKIGHVQYINDSKATNVNATYFALDSMSGPTVWIVGGVDKGNDYKELMPLVREKVKAIICLGLDNERIKDAFGNVVELMVETFAMSEALKVAYKIAERGDTVLLSPACASFDLFENYEDRGNQFKEEIKNL